MPVFSPYHVSLILFFPFPIPFSNSPQTYKKGLFLKSKSDHDFSFRTQLLQSPAAFAIKSTLLIWPTRLSMIQIMSSCPVNFVLFSLSLHLSELLFLLLRQRTWQKWCKARGIYFCFRFKRRCSPSQQDGTVVECISAHHVGSGWSHWSQGTEGDKFRCSFFLPFPFVFTLCSPRKRPPTLRMGFSLFS